MGNSAGPKITKDGLVLDFDAANPKSYNFYADPYASNVSLHLKMDGANGSTTFTDSSPNALAVTAVGNAQISTAQSKYNGSAGSFDGNGDTLTIPANAVFALGAGDYTIEGWFYSLTSGTSLRGMVDFRTAAAGTNGLMLRENDAGFLVYLNSATLLSTTTGRVANQWQHVALVRQGTTVTLYVNGVSQTTATSSTNLTDNIMRISGFVDTQSSVYAYNGYIDELKITKGVARYTSAFTSPPIPSTCTDLTRSKNVGTLTGGVDYNFSNGGSLVFDGVDDYIYGSLSSSTWASNFTICAWFKHTDYGNLWESIFSANTSSSYWGSPILTFNGTSSATRNQIGINNAGIAADGVFLDLTANHLNKWIFCALSLSGSTITISAFQDGILSSTSGTLPYTLNRTSLGYYIGRHYDLVANQIFRGSIANIMIYNKALTSTEVYNNFVANRGRFGV
jgi:hypothetical protein